MTPVSRTRSLRGVVAGITATAVMSAFMLLARRRGWMSELPPVRVTQAILEPLPGEPPQGRWLAASSGLLHVAIGAAAGTVFAYIDGSLLSRRVPAIARGVVFGSAVWLSAYVGLLPAMGLMPRPERDERYRPAAMLVAHWIYGAVLAVLVAGRPVSGAASDYRQPR
jgi:hypothetical protein